MEQVTYPLSLSIKIHILKFFAINIFKTFLAPPSDFIFDRSQLPTAPKAALVPDFNIESIPKTPPFTAHLSNVSFEADEEKIKAFFKDLKVSDIILNKINKNLNFLLLFMH
jgi:hypothetical protein